MIRTIIALCSRNVGHNVMYSRLGQALIDFRDQKFSWEHLVEESARQGIAPLLYKHLCLLDFEIPLNSRRLLLGLYLRNRRSNTIRNRAVSEILNIFDIEKIDTLLVKGIALCNFAYSETGLRPMRDIDLLVKKADTGRAEKILFDLGYQHEKKHAIPDDYYHLVPMRKTIDGLPVSVELHHNLLPFDSQYPRWPLEKSYANALEFEINGIKAYTLGLEDTLWYVYLHGFQAPLTYEPFRFLHVADIVTLVEKFSDIISWQRMRKEVPTFFNVLSRLHYLTPWQDTVATELELDIRKKQPEGTGHPYKGWPKRKWTSTKNTELFQLARDTVWPSQWWMQIYYGHLRGSGYVKARLLDHPRQIWRWAKAYRCLYLKNIGKNV